MRHFVVAYNIKSVSGCGVMDKNKRHLEYGDVIGIDLGFYQHFGVYIGDAQVIHYSPISGNVSKDAVIHITSFDIFLGEEEEYFICDFSPFYREPEKIYNVVSQEKSIRNLISPNLNLTEEFKKANDIYLAFDTARYQLYSPMETVKRAYSRLGETSYDLISNNCEHFAIWCKTGISESYQVNAVLKILKAIWIAL